MPLTVACIAAPVQLLIGDWAGRTVAEDQPVKLAAFEGLEQTDQGSRRSPSAASTIDGEIHGGITIPDMLSLLAYHDPNATVQGLDSVPERDRPPVAVVRNAFYGHGLHRQRPRAARRGLPARPGSGRRACRARSGSTGRWSLAGPAAVVALIAGWITTEVGRQPWIVYEVMKTTEAVTGAEGIPIGYATLAVVYLGLGSVVFWLLRRLARQPLEHELPAEAEAAR